MLIDFVVRDEIALDRAGERRPTPHPRAGAGTREIDRRIAAERVARTLGRHVLLVRAPAEFRRLHPFRQEAVDRPGVDEFVLLLGDAGALRVAFGDVDALHAEVARQPGPVVARGRCGGTAEVARQMQQRALDQMAHHAGIGAVCHHRGRVSAVAAQRQRRFAHGVVGAFGDRLVGIGIAARRRFDARIKIQHAEFAAQFDQRDRRDSDREVDQEAAAGQQRRQDGAQRVRLQRHLLEPDAGEFGDGARRIIGIDDHHALARHVEMPQDERQCALADRAEADHHQGSVDAGVYGGRYRRLPAPSFLCSLRVNTGRPWPRPRWMKLALLCQVRYRAWAVCKESEFSRCARARLRVGPGAPG